jgi:hypothetical protein
VDSGGGPSQDPKLDVKGLFGIKGSIFVDGLDVFFLMDFPPLRC